LILAFWVVPSLIVSLVPIRYRELLKELHSAIVIAVVTSCPCGRAIHRQMTGASRRCRVEDRTATKSYRPPRQSAIRLPNSATCSCSSSLFAAFYFHAALQARNG
jgi:hypothetical protein